MKRLWLWIRIKACEFRMRSIEITIEGQREALTYINDVETLARIVRAQAASVQALAKEVGTRLELDDERRGMK